MLVAFAATLWLPNLLTQGMFMDGVFNALLGLNLANGVGSFWAPLTADYAQPNYWDNPQLSPFFLSLYYKAIGPYYWVDKLYPLTLAILQLILIALGWRIYFGSRPDIKQYYWLPGMLWLLIPLTSWGYSSNVMECTMTIFTTLSILLFFIYLRTGKLLLLYATGGGLFILLAMLTKGPVALFPLTAPLFFLYAEKELRWHKALTYMAVQLTATAIAFAAVFSRPDAANFLQHYLDGQLLRSLTHQFGNSAPPYTIFIQLAMALAPLLGLAVVAAFIKSTSFNRTMLVKTALVFIVIGLSASAPIALSAKQNKHYLIPSLPVFAMGFACLVLPLIQLIETTADRIGGSTLKQAGTLISIMVLSACISLSLTNWGNYSRDENLLRDLDQISELTGHQPLLPASGSLYTDWPLRANLYRHHLQKITMPGQIKPTGFYLVPTGEPAPADSLIYTGKLYDLYITQH